VVASGTPTPLGVKAGAALWQLFRYEPSQSQHNPPCQTSQPSPEGEAYDDEEGSRVGPPQAGDAVGEQAAERRRGQEGPEPGLGGVGEDQRAERTCMCF